MSAMTDYLENAILDHILGTAVFTLPASPTGVYLALFTASPGEAPGSPNTEVVGFGYSRQFADFNAASGGVAQNSANISFTASGGSWGTISHWALYDAEVDGNALIYGVFDVAKSVDDGDTLQVAVGDLDITAA